MYLLPEKKILLKKGRRCTVDKQQMFSAGGPESDWFRDYRAGSHREVGACSPESLDVVRRNVF